jgi:hypothetical protein
MSLVEDVSNWLADMPNQILPIFTMQFDKDIVNCIAVFPTGGGIGGNIGVGPTYYSSVTTKPGALDYPGCQIQVRYTDPWNAFAVCEAIRLWLDMNPPPGYVKCITGRSQPDCLTNDADLSMSGGPAHRYSCDYSFTKVRA